MRINPELLALAEWRLGEMQKQSADKTAFIPPGADAGGGGDPSMGGGGGPPPGTAAPGDPSMGAGGGAPPMDPSMGGGAGGPVAGGGGLTADSIAQIVTQTMQQQGGMGGMGGAGGPGGAGAGKMVKPDIATVAIDIFQVKKMLQYLFNSMGIPLPPDILDGPNRDPQLGTPMPPGAPGSTSDPQVTAQNAQNAPQAGGGGQQGGSIPPIQPMQAGGPGVGGMGGGAAGAAGGTGEKTGWDRTLHMGNSYPRTEGFDPRLISKAAALSAIVRNIQLKSK